MDAFNAALAGFTLTLLLLWFLGMLVFGALPAAWLASERGREPFFWVAVGLLLGPLALLLLGLAPLGTEGNFRRCPRCGESIRREATRCRHCAWEPGVPQRSVR